MARVKKCRRARLEAHLSKRAEERATLATPEAKDTHTERQHKLEAGGASEQRAEGRETNLTTRSERVGVRTLVACDDVLTCSKIHSSQSAGAGHAARSRDAKRWELNTVVIVNNNNRTTVGLANNTGQQ